MSLQNKTEQVQKTDFKALSDRHFKRLNDMYKMLSPEDKEKVRQETELQISEYVSNGEDPKAVKFLREQLNYL